MFENIIKAKDNELLLLNRKKGASSWNTGFRSKIKQSIRIFKDSVKIKRGEKVL